MFAINKLMDIKEIWKDIKGCEGIAQVSNHGRVRTLDRMVKNQFTGYMKKGIIRKTGINKGYEVLRLPSTDGKVRNHKVHRLVAEAFHPNPDNLPEVNHEDENKMNNHVDNLIWCDKSYNMSHNGLSIRIGKKKMKIVYQFDLNDNLIKEWRSASTAARVGGYHRGHICECCLGVNETHKGYKWSYTEKTKQ